MKTEKGIFSSSAAKTKFTCSGHLISSRFNKAGPVRHSRGIERYLIGATLYFPITNAKSAEDSFVNVDRPLRTSCPQMRQQTHEVRFYPSLYRDLSQPKLEVVFSISGNRFFTRFHFADPILSIFSPDAFKKLSHVNTERGKQSDWFE